jgi:D-sedoheptulose 7-phosphate isomerase
MLLIKIDGNKMQELLFVTTLYKRGKMKLCNDYCEKISSAINVLPSAQIEKLAYSLQEAWKDDKQLFICGNGGSAANALHIANDLFYGIARNAGRHGLKTHALPANQAIVSCLANDFSYADIYSEQLKVYARPGDLLIVLSGSGNSPNIVKALETAKELRVTSFAILGYSGGLALELADTALHIPVNDMQIAEDIQLIIGHMLMQWLAANPPQE